MNVKGRDKMKMTPENINNAVALKLKDYSWAIHKILPGDKAYYVGPDFCRSMGDAWIIVRAIQAPPTNSSFSLNWWAGEKVWLAREYDKDQRCIQAKADTAAMAICKLFLELRDK